ncbi:hypothetical protein ACWEN6_14000 [Sphaerisporangium sp. NPDC004334]
MSTTIPGHLAHLPTHNGMIVPRITLHHRNGTPILGAVDHDVVFDLLQQRRCQLCGEPLLDQAVATAKTQDFHYGYISEPAEHPECSAYSVQTCPMLRGRLAAHRPAGHYQRRCGDSACICDTWTITVDDHIRAAAPVPPFWTITYPMQHYELSTSPSGRLRGLAITVPDADIRLVSKGGPSGAGDFDLRIIRRLDLPWSNA